MGNNQTFKLRIFPDNKKYISFGGKLEEEMIQKFISFDIIWYASEESEKLENWIAFSNVIVKKISNENEFIKVLEKSYLSNLIIISSGSFSEKMIPLMNQDNQMPNIIIYCMNLDYHKKWSEKYESIIDVCVHPNQIFENLLKIQRQYDIPLFSYKIKYTKEFNFNYYDNLIDYEKKLNDRYFSLEMDDYEKFSIKTLYDYRLVYEGGNSPYFLQFILDSEDLIKQFYGIDPLIFSITNRYHKTLALNLYGLTLLSLYFSKLPYLFGVLTYEEIEILLRRDEEESYYYENYNALLFHMKLLLNKLIEEKTSILDETLNLKFLQVFLIGYIKRLTKYIYKFNNDDFSKYPVMIKYLIDLDFCFRYFFFRLYGWVKNITIKMRCRGALDRLDTRIVNFYIYSSLKLQKEEALEHATNEELNTMLNTLIIKDFIVIGNENFQKEIK